MKSWQALVSLLCLGLTTYFVYHTIHGRHGFEARKILIERSSLLDFEIKSLDAERLALERDVALLEPALPNADIVEETARDVLGFADPRDKILTLESLNTASAPRR